MLLKLLKDLTKHASEAREPATILAPAMSDAMRAEQQAFSKALLADFYRLMHFGAADNYDHNRFGFDGVDRSRSYDAGLHAGWLRHYFDHADDYFAAFRLLQDEASRELYRRLILYRMLGHPHVIIKDGVGWKTEAAVLDAAKEYDAGPSSIDVDGMFGPIRHHEGVPVREGGTIRLDCWSVNVAYTALKRQYYYSRDGFEIAPAAGDVVIDAGACFGDTAVYFAASVGGSGRVHAFDPLPAHNAVMTLNIRQNGFEERITAVPCAVGATIYEPEPSPAAQVQYGRKAAPGFSLLRERPELPVTTLDAYADEHALSRVDFIKMDIEGYELPALKGAQRILERFRPKLAISLYHNAADLFEIPLWLAGRFPDYQFLLDHYTIHHEETVLYAVSRRSAK